VEVLLLVPYNRGPRCLPKNLLSIPVLSPCLPPLSYGLVDGCLSLEGARIRLGFEVLLLVGPEPCCECGWLSSALAPALQAAAGVVYSMY
jgi:hypothetical protein